MKYYKIYWSGELICEIWARNKNHAMLKSRDYINSTGRLFDLRKLSVGVH